MVKLRRILPSDVVCKVADTPFDEAGLDSPYWKMNSTGSFSVKTAWELIREGRIRRPLLKDLWHQTISPSMSIFMWRLIQNFVPVDERLRDKGLPIVSKCLCCHQSETIQHLFLNGEVIREVWGYFGALFHLISPCTDYISNMIQHWKLSSPFVQHGHIRILIPILILWFAWRMRNDAKFNTIHFSAHRIIRNVCAHLTRLHNAQGMKAKNWKGDLLVAAKLGFYFPRTTPQFPR
ncbi:UNVERIFIED_CONTAM: hypothetical protein Slati_2248400 [Sesamum latifolium]|uniref:Reverse transcriptase zinc-binding domain-containing protein n=1 Tax=Sesamum latifolium TaxID=2727402 RepID=A0AAW2WTR8_9LAMI